jgi:hypothetical protein
MPAVPLTSHMLAGSEAALRTQPGSQLRLRFHPQIALRIGQELRPSRCAA